MDQNRQVLGTDPEARALVDKLEERRGVRPCQLPAPGNQGSNGSDTSGRNGQGQRYAPDGAPEGGWASAGSNGSDSSSWSVQGQRYRPDCSSDTTLCLSNNRFAVEVGWRSFDGRSGLGRVVPTTSDDSGLFTFFSPENWEMLVKMVDACDSPFNSFWVFSAATTNVEYTLRVTDTDTGTVREYFNPLGNAAPAVTDTSPFLTCPQHPSRSTQPNADFDAANGRQASRPAGIRAIRTAFCRVGPALPEPPQEEEISMRNPLPAALLALVLLTTACSSSPTEPDAERPTWLNALIAQIEAEAVTNPPTTLWSYGYQGEPVYYRPPRCCDISSVLYDESGSVLCHPDGGVTGQGDGACADFFENRTGGEVVWADPRG